MERFFKYKRIEKKVNDEELQELFDQIVTEGWEIIEYKEKGVSSTPTTHLWVSIIVGKKQDTKLTNINIL